MRPKNSMALCFFGLVIALSSRASELRHGTCKVLVYDLEEFFNLNIQTTVDEKFSSSSLSNEQQKILNEAKDGILKAKLNQTLAKKLGTKGYKVTLIKQNDITPINDALLVTQYLFLNYHLNFGFRIQPTHDDRRLTWNLELLGNTHQPEASNIKKSSTLTNIFRFTGKQFTQSLKQALDELPDCDIIVTDSQEEI